jgi:hypothetical protein
MNELTIRQIEALDERLFNNDRKRRSPLNATVAQEIFLILLKLVGDEVLNNDDDLARKEMIPLLINNPESTLSTIDEKLIDTNESLEVPVTQGTVLTRVTSFFRGVSPVSVADYRRLSLSSDE